MTSPEPPQLVEWLAPVEIAFMLKTSAKTVQGWLRDDNHPLKGTKIGTMWRVHPDDFATFMKGNK